MEKNFDFPFKVHLLASELPEWASSKLNLIPCEQVKGFENAKAFDAVTKMRNAINSQISQNFIYTYDDVIFLNTVSFADVAFRWSHNRLIDEANIMSFSGSTRWKNVMINTLRRLKVNKLPDYNYETHLPRVFNKRTMEATIEKFGFKRVPYMIPTIYFNFNFDEPEGIIDANSPSIEISKFIPSDTLLRLFQNRKILTYNDTGLNADLKTILLNLFPEKSSFEK